MSTNLGVRSLKFAMAAFLSMAIAGSAAAQTLSAGCTDLLDDERITIIVPNRAGGGFDTYGRAFAPVLAEKSGASVNVINMPGGGGRLAALQVAKQSDREILLIIEGVSDLVTGTDGDDSVDIASSDFAILGLVQTESKAIFGRPDLDITSPDVTKLVAAQSSILSSLVDVLLAGRAMNIEIDMIGGYGGSSENAAAVLRGEVDISGSSLPTAIKRAKGTDLKVLVVLDDKPDPSAPGVPAFGGEGGLVDLRSAGLPEAKRAELMELAELVIALGTSRRAFFTAASVEEKKLACLREATDLAVMSPEFAESARAQGRDVNPQPFSAASTIFAQSIKSHNENIDFLKDVAKEYSK